MRCRPRPPTPTSRPRAGHAQERGLPAVAVTHARRRDTIIARPRESSGGAGVGGGRAVAQDAVTAFTTKLSTNVALPDVVGPPRLYFHRATGFDCAALEGPQGTSLSWTGLLRLQAPRRRTHVAPRATPRSRKEPPLRPALSG